MELLAPAGGFEQALVSIESGCDALYGGLKKWSARNRAINLSYEEYKELIGICRQKGIKFYLTINTLLTDEEIESVRAFFTQEDIVLPDGILVADAGLISMFCENFPQIELHASTQLAAYSLEDVKYYEKLGFKRVVLARELTADEIAYIRKNTTVELEVFVYGNQCVVFSGNCLWGGMLHTGSGHRGRCIGACCDIYKDSEGQMGNFFWSCNIGLFGMIAKLKEIGVDSIKVEGRVRPLPEIERVIKKFREAISGTEFGNDYNYEGYLGGNLPPAGMLSYFNPENSVVKMSDVEFTENDYIAEERNGKVVYVRGDEAESDNYVSTLFLNKHKKNDLNCRLRILFEDTDDGKKVNKIDYINANGERTFYYLKDYEGGATVKIRVREIYELFKEKIKCNIYELACWTPANTVVLANVDWINKSIETINIENDKLRERNKFVFRNNDKTSVVGYVYVDNAVDASRMIESGYTNIICFIRNFEMLDELLRLEEHNEKVTFIYQLPYINFVGNNEQIYLRLGNRNVMITRPSQLELKEKYGFAQMYGDYMLNVWNSKSAAYFKSKGIIALIGHPEISVEEIKSIGCKSGMEMLLYRGGRIPLGYTRACFKKIGLCNNKCGDTITSLTNTMKGGNIQLVCNNAFGYRMIFSEDLFVSQDYINEETNVYSIVSASDSQKEMILNREYDDSIIIYNKYV